MSSEKPLPPLRRRVLSPGEAGRIKDEISRNEAELNGRLQETAEATPQMKQRLSDLTDKSHLRARNARLKRALAAGSPGPLSGGRIVELERRGKDLQEYLSRRMIPRSATQLRPGRDSGFTAAKHAMVKQELGNPDFQRAASEWKNIQRTLRPDEPDAANLERIRPD